jgi:hypothetical protein
MWQDDPLYKWIDEHDTFLLELLRLDGCGDEALWHKCRLCNEASNVRCEDCFGGELFCRLCMIDLHAISPLHRIEVCVFTGRHLATDTETAPSGMDRKIL